MQKNIFDEFADGYDELLTEAVKVSGFKPSYFHEYKIIELYNYLKSLGLDQEKLSLLNYGCGTGSSEKYIKKYLPNISIFSIDVSAESIRVAQKNNESFSDIVFEAFDGVNIQSDRKFDIIFIANVFHHIPRDQQLKSMKAISDKLNSNGFLIMFEHNPINPLTLWVAYHSDYKFDKKAKLLHPLYCRKLLDESGFRKRIIRFIVFFPSFLLLLNKLEKYLSKLPIGAQYYYIARK